MIHRWVTVIIETKATDRVSRRDLPPPPEGEALVPWFEEAHGKLVTTLEATSPEEKVWTFVPDGTAGFWHRRQAQETAVHRWDAESGHGQPAPIGADLAIDGIDELLLTFGPGLDVTTKMGTDDKTLHLHATDAPGEWLLTFAPDGFSVAHEHSKGDAAARGTASDLLLFLWGRIPATRLETFGDVGLLDRWQSEVKI